MFDRILIANRGEIACRVIRTARRMGVGVVAVYSAADQSALHVEMADDSYYIGPAPAAESYLAIGNILDAAKASGAQAIHPGYGFLAENADFAEACAAAGITFIGPTAEAIRAMGSKSAAKSIMVAAGVPVVPGYHGKAQGPKKLKAEADKIGYPLLVKASAGGGGKGMRLVERAAGFDDALAGARREAKNAFGDDTVLIEKFVDRPRHIEMQVFADRHGNAVHLFERDCSVQRRHQKVIEEAPAPGMTAERRERMGAAAVAAATAIGYEGAGTVEFIVGRGGSGAKDADGFYFMEMNTRLQVEHPVTEMITGQDLVEWQLRVAAGEPLPKTQDELAVEGHAVEARLYAEDPERDFLPATGLLTRVRFPENWRNWPIRVDTGVRTGDAVSMHYDPMIAKVIAWGESREDALHRLGDLLAQTEVAGVATNARLLSAVIAHPSFVAGDFDTGFIARFRADLIPAPAPAPDRVLACAALAVELERAKLAGAVAASSGDPYSPWHDTAGWRLNGDAHHVLRFADPGRGGEAVAVTVHYRPDYYILDLPGGSVVARAGLGAAGLMMTDIDGVRARASVEHDGRTLTLFVSGVRYDLGIVDPVSDVEDLEADEGRLTAPMSGRISDVMVKAGGRLDQAEPILIPEAMKMEHTIAAPADGLVKSIHFAAGDQVEEGAELVDFEAAES